MEKSSCNSRAKAERCLAIAEKLLAAHDLVGSKNFARRAHESDPLLDGVDGILAVADVLLASEKRLDGLMDWYAILQLNSFSDEDLLGSMKNHYRRLARLLHPDKNRLPGSGDAFRLVVGAWTVLSDPAKRAIYDKELAVALNVKKLKRFPTSSKPATKTHGNAQNPDGRVWVSCPYCCNLYEYAKNYENCRLRCQNCRRGFHAVAILSPPPVVPGTDAYYCSWGFFPLGVWSHSSSHTGFGRFPPGLSNWNDEKVGGCSYWKPVVPVFPGSCQGSGTRTEQREGSAKAPKWNGDAVADAEARKRRKRGAAGNEEPLLAVPISTRAPKEKKVVRKERKQPSRKVKTR